ncbi:MULTISPECIES: exo-alpha-sialidase [unclassified Polynucleobacter]|uniref:exo-alpha-sialidase n=1 Tax=unclassified Polynucleobacter TaxID=2640945 RepID=UPI002574051D|nr:MULTISPECIES: sialidase family protein [unclassified Polynucleobacter]BEI43102.1 exo-alpha-sialidase [Polynucleobacter sp. HIN10]BEI44879.1 exo-alpha-sialidase [Polynucleobacter sp. HIN11]
MSMMRVLAFVFLVVAIAMAYFQLDDHPAWADFQVPSESTNTDPILSSIPSPSKTKTIVNAPTLQGLAEWLPDTTRPSVHAASVIPLKDGNWRAFWFAGSREGAADVVIQSAVWDSTNKQWGPASVVLDREGAQASLGRYIAKLGNPVPMRNINGQLQLYVVAVSIGGWAGSSISVMHSDDDGLTWTGPKRLITTPLINLSTLVKGSGFLFADGTMGMPVYHEWIGKYGELLRLDPSGQMLDKRRMTSGRGTLQPIVFIDDAKHASAYFRQARRTGAKQIPVSYTASAGERWELAPDLGLPNPNAAITGVELSDRTRLIVFNDLEHGRHRLVLAASWSGQTQADSSQPAKSNYSPWKTIAVLEDETASMTNPKEEFSYPYMSLNQQGQVLLVYTWNRKRIKSILWDAGNLQLYLQHVKAETDQTP